MTCCPDQDRIDGVLTRGGQFVGDLHRHRRMLRGFVEGSSKPMFWYAGGRLTPLAETDMDLDMGGAADAH